MNLKKVFESRVEKKYTGGQAVIEYLLLFIVITIAVVLVFGGVNPEKLTDKNGKGVTPTFQSAVAGAVHHIQDWK